MVNFLIIRFSSIGDIVLTTPLVRCLKQQVADARIIYLTKKNYVPVLETNPYIDELLILNDKINQTIEQLRELKIDYIIDLHNNLRSGIIKRRLKRISFTINKLNLEKWLMVNLKFNRLPQKHIVDREMETVTPFGVKNDMQGLDFFLQPDTDTIDIAHEMPSAKNGYVAIALGAMHNTKQIPADKITALCNALPQTIILLGGSADAEKAKTIISSSNNNHIFNACGKYNIRQSAYLIQQATVVITPDTGLMHIAAAFKKHIISIWGNTIPAFGMYPYQPGKHSSVFENNALKCRPCSKIGHAKCPKKHFECMNSLDINKLADKTQQIYTASGN